jgi:5'-deoxynucleotidase YfbR-like HD superfamily hydrolase
MQPNRIVALITPFCALAAGWVASWIAQNFPDADISKESLQAVFIGGMLAVIAPAAQWLHGWQKYEERQAETERIAIVADAVAGEPDLEEPEDVFDEDVFDEDLEAEDLDEFDEFEDLEEEFGTDEQEPVSAGT